MSLRAAINAKCRDCIYDPESGLGNWRQQVSSCTATECPLYSVRPLSKSRGARSRGAETVPREEQNGMSGTTLGGDV